MSELTQAAMDADTARRLTERIRIAAVNYSEAKEKLLRLVSEAKDGSAHVALGYASWTAYLADVMSEEPLRLARDERREVVQLLSDEGMSTRAIAPVFGVHHDTVAEDRKAGVGNPTPDPAPRVPNATSAPSLAPAPSITGMDGKEYSRPEPREPPKHKEPSPETTLVNDIRLYLSHIGTSKETARLPTEAKRHLIEALELTITQLKGQAS